VGEEELWEGVGRWGWNLRFWAGLRCCLVWWCEKEDVVDVMDVQVDSMDVHCVRCEDARGSGGWLEGQRCMWL